MFSVHLPTIPGSGDRSEAIYPPGRNPFFFSSLLIRELCARSWSRPPAFCAEFRLEMLNWRTRDEENTRNEKKEHPLLSQRGEERDSSLSKTGRRAYDTRLWIRRKEVDYAPRVIATFNRNHHVRMKKIKEKKKKIYKIPQREEVGWAASEWRNYDCSSRLESARFSKRAYPDSDWYKLCTSVRDLVKINSINPIANLFYHGCLCIE